MRADRLLTILLLLQVHRRMTARQLAERLEVSERTVHRDMDALSASGIPLYAERGTGGGWVLPDDFRTKLPGLTETEIRALFLSTPARLLADLGLERASDAGLIKLLAALPSSHRLDAEYARQRIHLDGAGWNQVTEAVPFLPMLQAAIWEDRLIHITYERSDRAVVERLVGPLGLVAKRSTWYLVAMADDAIRTFRVSRVASVTVTEERFLRPPAFDLAAYWQQSSEEFVSNLPRYPAVLRVAPSALPRVREASWLAHVEQEYPPAADGWVTVCMRFDTREEACRFVLGFGAAVEVREPAELREQVRQTAARIVELHLGCVGRESS